MDEDWQHRREADRRGPRDRPRVISRVEQGCRRSSRPSRRPTASPSSPPNGSRRHVDKNGLRSARNTGASSPTNRAALGRARLRGDRRSDIAGLLDFIEDHHGPHQADAVLSVLRMVGNWQRDRSDDYVSPFAGVKRRVAKQDRKRQRKLNDDEIRACGSPPTGPAPTGPSVRLLLTDRAALDKVRTMRWRDVAPDGTWTIRTAPREKGNAGALQLPKLALAIIARSRASPATHICSPATATARRSSIAHKLAFDKRERHQRWRLHDSGAPRARSWPRRRAQRPRRAGARPRPAGDRRHLRLARYDTKSRRAAQAGGIDRAHRHGPAGGNVVPLHETAAS